jgi:uncharacterized protein (DUF983 family)
VWEAPPAETHGGAGLLKSALLGRCPQCGLVFFAHDAGDGLAMAGIFLIGAIAVGLALWVDRRVEPDLWVHALIWAAVLLPLSLMVVRVAKAMLLGLQWRNGSTT